MKTLSVKEISSFLDSQNEWDQGNYSLMEGLLNDVFQKHPYNTNLKDVALKCSLLDRISSTNVYAIAKVARYIHSLNIDGRLRNKDLSIVDEIANTQHINKRRIYSFATKYCSYHLPDDYPIYDEFVKEFLSERIRKDNFSKFKTKDFTDYPKFKKLVDDFIAYYHLESLGYRKIDQYMWKVKKDESKPSAK